MGVSGSEFHPIKPTGNRFSIEIIKPYHKRVRLIGLVNQADFFASVLSQIPIRPKPKKPIQTATSG